MFFTFLQEKAFEKKFSSLNVWKAALQGVVQAASAYKRREFWRETHRLLWLLIGRIIFFTREETLFTILIGLIIFLHVKTIVCHLIG